jgi:SAM-dependent methyltransferase
MDSRKTRYEVSKVYAKAVKRSPGCCGGATPEPKGVSAQFAGYSADQVGALPADAVVNSFGCGNPVAFSEIGEGETVLDLGSGAGIDLLLAARKVGPQGRVIGVDMTEEMLAKARANLRAAGVENAEVRRGIIEELPVESGTVDWVISNCVINLSPEKPRVFAEIARVLKPGGRMLVSDIVAEKFPEELRGDLNLYAACIAGAVSEGEYLEGLRAAGLEQVEVRDRLIYDAGQIGALVGLDGAGGCCGGSGCCGGAATAKPPAEIGRLLEGKLWSARVFARKPV